MKSLFWAYFWWFFGGIFGAHHLYLNRDNQAILWFFTIGGFFGIGWLRDLYRIPIYVADANDDPTYIERFKDQVKSYKKPPSSWLRHLGCTLFATFCGKLLLWAIPEDPIGGVNLKYMVFLVPLAVTFGIWLVGNIGHHEGSIWIALLIAYLFYPTYYYLSESEWICYMVTSATFGFNTFSLKWRLKKKTKRSIAARVGSLTLCILIYSSLWASYFYSHGITITNSEGEEVELTKAVRDFFESPLWLDLGAVLNELWIHANNYGIWGIWQELINYSDPHGEFNAYRILGLSKTSTGSEISARWRVLSRENHPDKVKGSEEERLKAQEKFFQIQQAYENLSRSKSRRRAKNKRYY